MKKQRQEKHITSCADPIFRVFKVVFSSGRLDLEAPEIKDGIWRLRLLSWPHVPFLSRSCSLTEALLSLGFRHNLSLDFRFNPSLNLRLNLSFNLNFRLSQRIISLSFILILHPLAVTLTFHPSASLLSIHGTVDPPSMTLSQAGAVGCRWARQNLAGSFCWNVTGLPSR